MTAVTITQTQAVAVDGLRIRYADSGPAAGGPVIVFTSPWPESLLAFLAARHPDAVRSMVVGGGGAAVPLDVTGTV